MIMMVTRDRSASGSLCHKTLQYKNLALRCKLSNISEGFAAFTYEDCGFYTKTGEHLVHCEAVVGFHFNQT